MINLTDKDKAAIKKYNITDEQLEKWEEVAREKTEDQENGEEKEKLVYNIVEGKIRKAVNKKENKNKKEEVKKPEKIELSEEDKKRVEELKHDPLYLYRIKKALEKISVNKAVIGEDENKLNLFIKATGSLVGIPHIIVVKASSSAGKTHLIKRTLEPFFKVKTLGRLSNTVLDYMDLSEYDIIILQEAGEADLQKREFRLLSADDEGYTVAVTETDEDGHKHAGEYKIPPKTLITTTTAIDIPEEFSTRTDEISIDESKIQTDRILDYKTSESLRLVKQAAGIENYGEDILPIRSRVEGLKPYKVLIPYEKYLGELFKKFEELRIRRDIDKALNFVRLSALNHQDEREKVQIGDNEFLIADIIDFIYWIGLGAKNLLNTIKRIDNRIEDITRKIQKMTEPEFTKHIVAKKLGITSPYANELLAKLTERGIVEIMVQGRGSKPHEYILTEEYIIPNTGEDVETKNSLGLLMKNDNISNLMVNLRKNEEAFFNVAAVLDLKSVYNNNIKNNLNKEFGNPFTGEVFTREQIFDKFELLINNNINSMPKHSEYVAQNKTRTAAKDKDEEALKSEKKDKLLMSNENISKHKQFNEKKVEEPVEEINLGDLVEKPISESDPVKTAEQIEEDERDNNEFKKSVEELDGYVYNEHLSENGRHISDMQEKYDEDYGEDEGGEEE